MKISAQTVVLGNKKIKILKLDEIAEVKSGLSTGDNQYYLYKNPQAMGSYQLIDKTKVLTEKEISKIQNDEKLKITIANNGISKNMFNGKTIVPHDKGGSSDIKSGRLSNYFVESDFFVDWSEKNVTKMKKFTIADVMRSQGEKKIPKKSWEKNLAAAIRNPSYYFKNGITFSRIGLYSPTFRINSNSIFDVNGPTFFIKDELKEAISLAYVLGILCSKLNRYIIKKFVNNSVSSQVEDIKKLLIPICEKPQKQEIEKLVKEIIKKQKKNPDYNYQNHEQIEIDNLVYEIFGLDQELIDEVETWYARRYPKLIRKTSLEP